MKIIQFTNRNLFTIRSLIIKLLSNLFMKSFSVTIQAVFSFETFHTNFTIVRSVVMVHFKVLLHIANVDCDFVAEKALHLATVWKFC